MATINANFGTFEYRAGGVIAIPLTFPADVIVPSKSICQITPVSNADLTGVSHRIIGKGRAFEVVVAVPPNRQGSFSVDITGTVLNVSTGVWDTVSVDAVEVNYDTRIPRIVDYDIPANYIVGEKFDVRIAFNVPVTGWHANNTITDPGIFIEEGARLGTPLPHKWIGSSPPNFDDPVPDDLTGTDWQVLATPPGGHQGEWHGEEAQYYLIRFGMVPETATGIFNLTFREGSIRGPVS